MKRSEMLVHMQRVYGIRHVMVEGRYITVAQFMDELLSYMEEKGMLPPVVEKFTDNEIQLDESRRWYNKDKGQHGYHESEWEPEKTTEEKIFETWRPG